MNASDPVGSLVYEQGRTRGKIELIRWLGFVGNSHYCSVCMNTFHEDFGQHAPDCTIPAELAHDRDLK